jgi:hypothetical protein
MTKDEWDRRDSPLPMLRFLTQRAGIPTFRLFAYECCRRVESLIPAEERWKLDKLAELASGEEGLENRPTVADSVRAAEYVAAWCAFAQATDDHAGKVSFARAAVQAALIFGALEPGHNPYGDIGRFKPNADKVNAEYAVQAVLLRRLAPRNLQFGP